MKNGFRKVLNALYKPQSPCQLVHYMKIVVDVPFSVLQVFFTVYIIYFIHLHYAILNALFITTLTLEMDIFRMSACMHARTRNREQLMYILSICMMLSINPSLYGCLNPIFHCVLSWKTSQTYKKMESGVLYKLLNKYIWWNFRVIYRTVFCIMCSMLDMVLSVIIQKCIF